MAEPATIYALASGAGRAGVSVVRLSGPSAGRVLAALTGQAPPPRRRASLRSIRSLTGEVLDEAIVVWFPRPRSFTGEDVAELHVHGGPAVIEALFEALSCDQDLRPARPGEFTRRAFENGKLDLTAAEGLADLVEAETAGQRRQALRQMKGALAGLYDRWRAQMIAILALLDAELDFPDEDLPGGLAGRAAPLIAALADEIGAHLGDRHRGERVREGYRIAILGPPNAGKSSLLNALAERDAAIVSDIPGTTRDVVEIRLTLAGFIVWIADTAGLRDARDAIEAEGVRRALERAAQADLRVGVLDSAAHQLDPATCAALRAGDVLALNKADLEPGPAAGAAAEQARRRGLMLISTAARAGPGQPPDIGALRAALTQAVLDTLGADEAAPLTRARHRAELSAAEDSLRRAALALSGGVELAAEDVRLASRSLGRITGRIDVEHVLDAVFSQFCIGK